MQAKRKDQRPIYKMIVDTQIKEKTKQLNISEASVRLAVMRKQETGTHTDIPGEFPRKSSADEDIAVIVNM